MPNECYIPNCLSGHSNDPTKRIFFCPPKDPIIREEWRKMIPRNVPAIHKTARVCELHFEEEDIIKGKTFIINGEDVFFPMRWKLRAGALPRIFPGCPDFTNEPSKRRPPIDPSTITTFKRKRKNEESEIKQGNSANESTANNLPTISEVYRLQTGPTNNINLREIRLPHLSWSWVSTGNPDNELTMDGNLFCSESVVGSTGKIYSRRSVKLNLISGAVSYYVFGVQMNCQPISFKTTFCSENDISNLLSNFQSTKLCPGFPVPQIFGLEISSSLLGFQDEQIIRSPNCNGISPDSKSCSNCQSMENTIQKTKSNNENNKKNNGRKVEGKILKTKTITRKLEAAKHKLPLEEDTEITEIEVEFSSNESFVLL